LPFVDTETGELQGRRLEHREEAEKFYRDRAAQAMKVRVGIIDIPDRWIPKLKGQTPEWVCLDCSDRC
jgi:hypothetical protein